MSRRVKKGDVVKENSDVFLIAVITESGCNFDESEYSIHIYGIIQGSVIGNDTEIIYNCIGNLLCKDDLPEEGSTSFIMESYYEDDGWPHQQRLFKIIARLDHE